jgi:4-amino-4-deoxy-L-arabinose transferase-like glycosyltransferase
MVDSHRKSCKDFLTQSAAARLFDMNRFLTLITILHIVLCIVFSQVLFPIVSDVFNVSEIQDEYEDLAINLYKGNGFKAEHGEESVIRGPAYPAFIAVIYTVFGQSHNAVFIMQALLSGLNVMLCYFLIRRLHSRRVALFSALLFAINPFTVWYTSRLMVETLFMTICLLIFITSYSLFKRATITGAILTGVTVAVAAFIKSIALAFPILVIILLLISTGSILKTLQYSSVVVLTLIVLVLPWTIRNYQVTDGEIIPVHASLALPLTQSYLYIEYFGENPMSARPAFAATNDKLEEITASAGYEPFHYPLHSLESELKIEKAAKEYFKNLYLSDPLMYIGHSMIRLLLFWYYSTNTLFSIVWLVISGLLLFLAIPGLMSVDGRHAIFVISWTLFIWFIHAAIIASARFSIVVQPLLLSTAIPFLFYQMPWLKRLPGLRRDSYNQHLMPEKE